MSDDILFDNFIITDTKSVADSWADDSWLLKHEQELIGTSSGRSVVDAVLEAMNERPWLWAVFAIVVVLPLLMLVVYCCMPASKVCRCSITTEGLSFLSNRCLSTAVCQRPRSVTVLSLMRVYLSCLIDVCLLLHASVQGLSLFYQ